MEWSEPFLSGRLWLAISLYLGWAMWFEYLGARLHHRFQGPLEGWAIDGVFLALARTTAILMFVAIAYPAIFHLADGPSLNQLLNGGSMRVNHLLNITLLLTLLLPLIPAFSQRPDVILPLQFVFILALLFDWLGHHFELSTWSLWPELSTAFSMFAWVAAAPFLAGLFARLAANVTDQLWQPSDIEQFYYEFVLLVLQLPAVLLYTRDLSRQLPAVVTSG